MKISILLMAAFTMQTVAHAASKVPAYQGIVKGSTEACEVRLLNSSGAQTHFAKAVPGSTKAAAMPKGSFVGQGQFADPEATETQSVHEIGPGGAREDVYSVGDEKVTLLYVLRVNTFDMLYPDYSSFKFDGGSQGLSYECVNLKPTFVLW